MEQMHACGAAEDFARAKAKARRSKIAAFLRGKRDDLLSFEDVKRIVGSTGESYAGCRTVPVDRIVGSEGRVEDFNESFCPRRDFMRQRWVRVDAAYFHGIVLPPVKLLEIGGVYFVRDGNHRVSIARTHKVAYIDAEVTKLSSNIVLHPRMKLIDIEREKQRALSSDSVA